MASACLAPRSPLCHRRSRAKKRETERERVEWVTELLERGRETEPERVEWDVPQPPMPDYLLDAIQQGRERQTDASAPADDSAAMMDVEDGEEAGEADREEEALEWIASAVSDGEPVSPVSEPNRAAEGERARTLIVLDYDDTLFPTTELRRLGYATTVQEQLPDAELAEIQLIEAQAVRLVELCAQHGSVILLTNAEGRWLRLSTASYMPRLHKQLAQHSRTVYGREFAETCPDDPGRWKELAFRDVLQSLRQELGDDRPIRLVSVGDSTFERQAAKDAGAASDDFGKVEVKTVKMMDLPTFSLLKRQLEVLCLALAPILDQQGPLDVEVACNDSEEDQTVDDGRPGCGDDHSLVAGAGALDPVQDGDGAPL